MRHLLTPQFMLGEGWLQWYMVGNNRNVFSLLCRFMLNCEFLELLCPSVIAQCWDYRSRSVEQSWFVVKAQPAGWRMWGRGWIFAEYLLWYLGCLSGARMTIHPLLPVPQTWWGRGDNSWIWRYNQELCGSGCVFKFALLCRQGLSLILDPGTFWLWAVWCWALTLLPYVGLQWRGKSDQGISLLMRSEQNQRQVQNAANIGSLIEKYHRKVKYYHFCLCIFPFFPTVFL